MFPGAPATHPHTLQLFTHRADVDAVNAEELTRLPGEEVAFRAQDEGQADVLRTGCAVRIVDQQQLQRRR